MSRTIISLGLFAALLSAQTQPLQPPERKAAKPGSVTVTVINSVTQQPLPQVRISLFPGTPLSIETDENGRAVINGVAPGTYIVSLSVPAGFTSPSRDRFTVKEGESVTVPPMALIPPGGIEGVVRDEDGNAIAGADVEGLYFLNVAGAIAAGMPLQSTNFAVTDEKGHYRLANVRPEPMIVRVSRQGPSGPKRFPRTYYPGVLDVKQSLRLHVLPGRDVERIDFRVRYSPAFHVRGRVVLAGPPQELPTLFLRPCDSNVTGTTADVGDDGTFDFSELLPGTYCIRYQELRLSDNAIVAYAAAEVMVIDRDVERVQLAPVGLQSVSGTIQLEEGATMPRELNLSAMTAGVRGASGAIDASGRFTLDTLFSGTYRLSVNSNTGYGYIKSARLGSREIDVDSFTYAGEPGPLVLRVERATSSLHGRITASSGVSLSRRPVLVAQGSPAAGVTYSTVTNDQGEFVIQGVIPGSYRVSVWETDEFSWVRVPEFLDRFAVSTVSVKDNQQAEVEVRLIPTAEIEKVKASF